MRERERDHFAVVLAKRLASDVQPPAQQPLGLVDGGGIITAGEEH